ncbi:Rrf2 family transcriptional regulator [Ammoniphilus sp. YIM 78166]|uniref:Rrf2 family transcriptional regulator n=1 Tax=Ammoniphilus sp. YIM 78166 TaxID=1644106 RepID=UPI001430EE4A|nr:Rrf2 family transcriptional regulator [Ammoniphilus sp. YIM 78166]
MQLILQSGDLGPKWFHVALRAMVLMARSNDLVKSHHIAEIIGADPTYLRKILIQLSKTDLVVSQGGRYGGYALKKESCQITVGAVYRALSATPPTPHWTVPATTGSELFISLIISKAEEEFQSILDSYTIKDLVEQSHVIK